MRSVPGGCSRFSSAATDNRPLFPPFGESWAQDLVAVTWTRRLSSAAVLPIPLGQRRSPPVSCRAGQDSLLRSSPPAARARSRRTSGQRLSPLTLERRIRGGNVLGDCTHTYSATIMEDLTEISLGNGRVKRSHDPLGCRPQTDRHPDS